MDLTRFDYSAHRGDLSRGPHERDVSRCAGACCAPTGFTQVFVGVILVALMGNAAEHSTAVMVALKNKMDLACGIAVGSSLQIALLVAPLLVYASYFFGTPLELIFTPFEVAAVTISVLIVGFVAMD